MFLTLNVKIIETEYLIYIFTGFRTLENIENSCATHERSSISNVKALNILYASSECHGRNNTRVCSTRFMFPASCSLCSIRDFKMFKTQTPESRFLLY